MTSNRDNIYDGIKEEIDFSGEEDDAPQYKLRRGPTRKQQYDKPHQCPHCDKKFWNFFACKMHLREQHGG